MEEFWVEQKAVKDSSAVRILNEKKYEIEYNRFWYTNIFENLD